MTKRWIWAVLGAEVAVVVIFAAVFPQLDFGVYVWGGRAVLDDDRLYLERALGMWFTYPPFAAVLFAALAALPVALARVLWAVGSVGALAVACWVTSRLAGRRPSRTTLAGVVAAALLLAPVYHTFVQGQVNLLLLALILGDVALLARGGRAARFAGVGVGLATAIKLTPGIFVLLFLVAGRTRAALTAALAFLGGTGVGLLVAPEASLLYWTGLFRDTGRVGAPYISNQSPYAAALRVLGPENVGGWYVVVPLALGLVGLAIAGRYARRGDWLAAATATGVTGLLVSPISWSHHWVWIVPALALLVRDGARVAAAAGYAVFAVAPHWLTPHDGGPDQYGWHGLVTVVANCYLIAGLVLLAYLRRHAAGRDPGPDPHPRTYARRPMRAGLPAG
ncbi:glycosyltransferase 87 family protein [Plantactinospora sp. GCM10030261]|uniref:glycosyltransferase 87 family protein n=1 Tax=Plantactinospora sp. GCM10030261 TaxID=3273420 RepID=UPI003620D6D7